MKIKITQKQFSKIEREHYFKDRLLHIQQELYHLYNSNLNGYKEHICNALVEVNKMQKINEKRIFDMFKISKDEEEFIEFDDEDSYWQMHQGRYFKDENS